MPANAAGISIWVINKAIYRRSSVNSTPTLDKQRNRVIVESVLMKRLIPTLLYGALAAAFGAQAATPQDTLVVVSSLEGIISLDPAESFETVSSANLVNLYQRPVAPDRAAPQKLAPDAAGSWQAGADGRSLTFTLKPQQRFASGNPLRPEDVIFSLVRAVKLNKAPSFILGEFGWTPDNVEQQLKRWETTVCSSVGPPTSAASWR